MSGFVKADKGMYAQNCIIVLPVNILMVVVCRLLGPHDTLPCVLITSLIKLINTRQKGYKCKEIKLTSTVQKPTEDNITSSNPKCIFLNKFVQKSMHSPHVQFTSLEVNQ